MMSLFIRALVLFFVLLLAASFRSEIAKVSAQESPPTDICADVRHMIALRTTPYQQGLQGGVIEDRQSIERTLMAGDYADFWALNLADDGVAATTPSITLNLMFDLIQGEELEFGVFRGMLQVQPYTPLRPQSFAIQLSQFGTYTVVVRRNQVSNQGSASYRLNFSVEGPTRLAPIETGNIRDAVSNLPYTPDAQIQDGVLSLPFPIANARMHLDSTRLVSPRNGQYTQVFFPDDRLTAVNRYSMAVGGWAQEISFLGGDFAAVSTDPQNPRIYFVEGFDYKNTISGSNPRELELNNMAYGDGTRVAVDWSIIEGLWVTRECTGALLRDGRIFTAQTSSQDRNVSLSGALESFLIQLNVSSETGEPQPFRLQMDWNNIETQSSVVVAHGTVEMSLVHERQLTLQSLDIEFATQPPLANSPGRLDGALRDRDITFALDWINMGQFVVGADALTLGFTDVPRAATTRPLTNLQSVEALQDVVHLVYSGASDAVPGETRLLLPASESYIEVVTPEGLPNFDGRALPGQPGYTPRALNNTGGECSPTGALVEPASCPPNGHPNPANGNFWLGMIDAAADGDLVSLAVSRSYNSRYAVLDSPFGRGWTTEYLVDYNIPFDPVTSARTLIPGAQDFAIGLDLTWAPRGIVTFTSPTGSRHTFVSAQPGFNGGELRSITMPDWILSRADMRDPIWRLTKPDGETLEFDRAGRLLRFGYPGRGRVVEIAYPDGLLNGPADLGDQPLIVRDVTHGVAPERQLEIYFNSENHIRMTRLRSLLGSQAGDCTLEANCLEVRYEYSGDLLTRVTYPDGQIASYAYDDAGRLVEHQDPRAPISPRMRYSYDQDGGIAEIVLLDDAQQQYPWRWLSGGSVNGDRRQATLTDEWGNARTYSYAADAGQLRTAGNTFTLVSETSPLATVDPYEAIPQNYEWSNGLLTRIASRVSVPDEGRNGIDIQYAPDSANVTCIACTLRGMPDIRVGYNVDATSRVNSAMPELIIYANGASESFDYLPGTPGLVERYTNRDGATYVYTWSSSPPLQVLQVLLEQDGMTWDYAYTPSGLVSRVTQRSTPDDPGYTITFDYDGLGRLTRVTDSELGSYTYHYELVRDEAAQRVLQRLIITDPLGAREISDHDARGILIERSVTAGDVTLKRTSYTYDVYGRLIEKTRWDVQVNVQAPLTTRYAYQSLAQIAPVRPGEAPVDVLGFQVVITDAYGREEQQVYDALGRLRMNTDATGSVSLYNYLTNDTGQILGLRIEERVYFPTSATPQIRSYLFDARWQFRGLQSPEQEWQLDTAGDSIRPRSLTFRTVGGRDLQQVVWNEYVDGRTTGFDLRQPLLQFGGTDRPDTWFQPGIDIEHDFLGRPLRTVEGNGSARAIAYCPLERGYMRQIYAPAGEPSAACDTADSAHALTFDPNGRITEARDNSGRRSFVYVADSTSHRWLVSITLMDNDGTTHNWLAEYDALGQQTAMRTEAAYKEFRYDSLGRLIAVLVEGQPEASYRFEYNAADRVVRAVDGTGKGFSYSYDALGNVTNRIDARSAYTTSFTYDANGHLTNVISPEGVAFAFLFEDPVNPSRVTASIGPSGNRRQYTWDDEALVFSYIDANGNEVAYQYDSVGLLWRIEDALRAGENRQRAYALRYDDNAQLTAWLSDVQASGRAARSLFITRPDPFQWLVSQDGGTETVELTQLTFSPMQTLVSIGDVQLAYDAADRLRSVGTQDQEWDLTYDAAQPTITVTDPFASTLTLSYDALYRRISEEDTQFVYASELGEDGIPTGRVDLTVQDAIHGERRYSFTPGNARRNTPPKIGITSHGQRAEYVFNENGVLESITMSLCLNPAIELIEACEQQSTVWTQSTYFFYDALGQPIRAVDENGNAYIFAYDPNGNLVTYQDLVGRTYTYNYDSANRLTRVISPTGINLLLNYDTLDRVVGICRSGGAGSDTYDTCQNAGGELETYEYDTLGRLSIRTFGDYADGDIRAPLTTRYRDASQLPEVISFGPQSQINLTYDGLDLLESLSTADDLVVFGYRALNRLATAGASDYTYDSRGSLTTISEAGWSVDITQDSSGVTMADQSGVRLTRQLDARGILSSLGLELPWVEATYFENAFDLTSTSIDAVVSYSLDDRWNPLSLIYDGETSLDTFYERDPAGNVLRQSLVIASPDEETRVSFVRAVSLDNEGRPQNLRVTQVTDSARSQPVELQVVYTQTFTYDAQGNRVAELIQYANNSQIQIVYAYDRERISSVTLSLLGSQAAVNTSAAMLAAGAFALLTFRYRHGRYARVVLLALGISLASLSWANAQQGVGAYRYDYDYDASGNLTAIMLTAGGESPSSCIQATYDDHNRLVRLVRPSDSTDYVYDAWGRLVRADDVQLSYLGGTHDLTTVRQGASSVFFAQPQDHPALYAVDETGNRTSFIHDGERRIIGIVDPNASSAPQPWLFDLQERLIRFGVPDLVADPCKFSGVPADIPAELRLLPLADGTIWDTKTNLYFVDQRVYDPNRGQFMQPDLGVPQAFGNAYTYPLREVALPIRQREAQYLEGLRSLSDSLAIVNINDTLTAEYITNAHLHDGMFGSQTPEWVGLLEQMRSPYLETIANLSALPKWLEADYNLSAPTRDMSTGALSLSLGPLFSGSTAHREQFTPLNTAPVQWRTMLGGIADAGDWMANALAHRHLPHGAASTYLGYDGRSLMTQLQGDPQSARVAMPTLSPLSPDAVLNWLPQTLAAPEVGVLTLDGAAEIYRSAQMPNHELITTILSDAFPSLPDLPAGDIAAWQRQWFNTNLTGLSDIASAFLPEIPAVPNYPFGSNLDWLDVLEGAVFAP